MRLEVWVSHWQIISVVLGSRSTQLKQSQRGWNCGVFLPQNLLVVLCLCMYCFVTYWDAFSSAKGLLRERQEVALI